MRIVNHVAQREQAITRQLPAGEAAGYVAGTAEGEQQTPLCPHRVELARGDRQVGQGFAVGAHHLCAGDLPRLAGLQ